MHRNSKIQPEENSRQYMACVTEILEDKAVRSMKIYNQHRGVDCLQHSLNVSVASYNICRRLGLDYCSAARGGLLHDFFLYDWHKENPHGGLHAFRHPKIAMINANKHFELNSREMDVIKKHMWPLTVSLPKYPETVVVILVDKFFCITEVFRSYGNDLVRQIHTAVCNCDAV